MKLKVHQFEIPTNFLFMFLQSDWQAHFGHLHYVYVDDSRITGPISTKFGTKHSWVMRTQVCSNECPNPFLMGDNKEIAKIH